MNSPAAAASPDVISKGEFARRRGVSPGRVSQWISEGKIGGAAIVGEGRAAQIRETVAVEQLRRKLDPMQMTANGLTTNLAPPPPASPQPSPSAPPLSADLLPFAPPPAAPTEPLPRGDNIEDKIKRERLEQLERTNREGQRQEALAAGRLTDAALAKQIAGRETARLVSLFEGSLSNFATAIAAEFKLTQRDVLHLLRGEFRKFRAETAADARARMEAMPALVDVNLSAAEEETEDA